MTAVDTTTGEIVVRKPFSLVQVDDQCESVEEWAAQCESIAEVKEAADRLSALTEYASRRSKEARARVAGAQRRLECRIGVLLEPAEQGRNQHSDGGVHRDEPLFHKAQRWEFRAMAANFTIVEQVIADAGDNGYPSRRAVIAAIRETIVEEPEVANDTRRNMPAAERAGQIADLAAKGHRASQIADLLGIGEPRVRELANAHDVTLPDKAMGRTRAIDPRHVLEQLVTSLANEAVALEMVGLGHPRNYVTPEEAHEWAASLTQSLKSLNRLRNQLKEAADVAV